MLKEYCGQIKLENVGFEYILSFFFTLGLLRNINIHGTNI